MAWHGTGGALDGWGPRPVLIYWGVFFLFLLMALYMALLDLRYIWLQFKLGERALYNETLGEEAFRKEIGKARGRAGRSPE